MAVCGAVKPYLNSSMPASPKDVRPCLDLQQLVDEFFNWRVKDMPHFATHVGIHDYDDHLDDLSLAAYKRRYEKSKEFLARAEALEPRLALHSDLITLRVFKHELLTFIEGFPFQGFLVPLSYIEGPHQDFMQMVSRMKFKTPEDYEKLLCRYSSLPKQVQQCQELMEEGMAKGYVNHAVSMKGLDEKLGKLVVTSAEDSPLWPPLTSFPSDFTKEQITDFQTRGAQIITSQVAPAIQKLLEFLAISYVTRSDISASSLPNGSALYKQLIKYHTSTSMTPQEIHQLGMKEVARIESEMTKIVSELGHDMTLQEFSAMIKKDPKFFCDSPEDMLSGFQHIVDEVIKPKLSSLFSFIPMAELRVVADPSPSGTGGYHIAGSYDGSQPGVFYANTFHYNNVPKFIMLTLAMHEGNPGHHLQSSYCIESATMPFFRRVLDDRWKFQAPSNFPLNTAFMEGWALYSESLGFDLDLYNDPYDRFGHYSDELLRACRLVVDTGMHALNWSRQEAVDYMLSHSTKSRVAVENEIDRYITWPGHALAYKLGDLKLKELRAQASDKLGASFDIKKFHAIVLECMGPLDLVEDEVNAWISSATQQ